jgi:glycosyltransferase involved in cell wall biosynthesis
VSNLSVVVPAHDDEVTVRSALQSAEESVAYYRSRAGRLCGAAEVIVIDDGSRDGTLPIVLDFAKGKELFRVFHRRSPSSPSAARNCGASLAKGDVVFFLDADDVYLERHVFECCRALDDPAIDFVKSGVGLSDPVHPDWHNRIKNSLAINLAVRRRCHEFVGGFPDIHLFRRVGDTFEPWLDVFRLIEDVHYNNLLARFFRRGDVPLETVRYQRHPGNSFDRQYERFQVPFGSFPAGDDQEFDFRVRLSRLIVDYQGLILANKRAQAAADGPAGIT